MIRGIGTSQGIGIGHALRIEQYDVEIRVRRIEDVEAEKKRFRNAVEQFVDSTEVVIKELGQKLGENDKTALVLQNQIYLAKDAEMTSGVDNLIETKQICAEAAVDETCNLFIKIFSGMDNETMNQRVADIVDMRNQLVNILMGIKQVDLAHLPKDTVIVAKELHPSMTAAMDIDNIVGIVAEKGGDTSHAAILARALEIPAVLSVKDACDKINDKDCVIVDGEYGEVFVNPIERTLSIYRKKRNVYLEKREELKQYINKPTVTQEGVSVNLYANIGNGDDAAKAMAAGAEGVGLFRTEFLFMNGVSMPDEEEQFIAYRKAAVLCKDRPVIIRTLDIGGDKDIPYMGLTKESNPFLGYRAIRFCLDRVDVFTVQLRALLRASAYGDIRIMIPMITSVNELRQTKKMIADIMKDFDKKDIKYNKDIKIGVMIETPAAAMMADVLAGESDFFSIGTNDLTQYTMAVDRGNENVAYLYSVFNPAVLRTIRHIIKCAANAGIEVGMCGEAAANPAMIPLLISFGLNEFSVSPSKVLETRKNIASWTVSEADSVTEKVMSMVTEKEAATFVNDYIMTKDQLQIKRRINIDGTNV